MNYPAPDRSPLRVTLTQDGQLLITVGINIIGNCAQQYLDDNRTPGEPREQIECDEAFAKEIVEELEREDPDNGVSVMGNFLERVSARVIQQGSPSVREEVVF